MSRALRTLCPSCGAQVDFRADSSVLAVCAYCGSTLLRRGDALANLGRMAELYEDHSPLQLGAQGTVDGRAFSLIGRLQYRYAQGTWNEWLALDDAGRTAWLSEDNGAYVLSRDAGAVDAPPFEALVPGAPVTIDGRVWTVADVERARVIAGQGELPFVIGAGYEAPVADLRDEQGGFATLDYTDTEGATARPSAALDAPPSAALDAPPRRPRCYVGRAVALEALRMSGLREDDSRTVATEPFACPACGAPVQARLADTKTLTCASCASAIDVSQGIGARIAFFRQARRVTPALPLGASGAIDGTTWTVVGFMRRAGRVEDERFSWDEYLLHAPQAGFAFLVCDHGHWSWSRVLQRAVPTAQDRLGRGYATYEGTRFDAYARYAGEVDYVEGEFYWRVEQGERTDNTEYVAPPRGLSRERSANEVTWSLSRYLPAAEVASAFSVRTLPKPQGVGMLEPATRSNWRTAYRAMLWAALAAVLVVQLGTWTRGGHRELVGTQRLQMGRERVHDHLLQVTGSRATNVIVAIDSAVTNDAFDVEATLVSQSDGDTRAVEHEIGYWQGRDSDGDAWTEGARSDRIVFSRVTPGAWLLRITAELDPDSAGDAAAAAGAARGGRPYVRPDPTATYRVEQDSRPSWLTFIVVLPFLGLLYAFGVRRAPDPERERWADSVYGRPPGQPAPRDARELAARDSLAAPAARGADARKGAGAANDAGADDSHGSDD